MLSKTTSRKQGRIIAMPVVSAATGAASWWRLSSGLAAGLLVCGLSILGSSPGLAQTAEPSDEAPVSFRDCDARSPNASPIRTEKTICQQGLTQPSLWWVKEQIGSQLGRKLVSNWRTHAAPAESTATESTASVQLVVNSQAWSLLDYFERYEFLHAFGLTARDFGYGLEVVDSRGNQMATYRCFGDRCSIQLGGSGNSGFRSQQRGFL